MESPNKKSNISLSKAFMLYLASVAVFAASWGVFYGLISIELLDTKVKWPLIPLGALYFGIGVFLIKVIFNNLVIWHPLHNTLSNVVSMKIKQVLFWPLTYPVLLTHYFISEKL